MGAVCQRRAPTPTPVQKPVPKSRTTSTPKLVPTTKPSSAARSIDYSKWDNLVDSDDEEEEKPQKRAQEAAKASKASSEQADAPDMMEETSLSRWSGKGKVMIDEFKALCCRARNELKDELRNPGHHRIPTESSIPKSDNLPSDYKQPVGLINVDQLSRYSSTNDRNLVSVYGDIFDVSSRPDLYRDGKHAFQCGRDITWITLIGKEDPIYCNEFYDILKLEADKMPRFLHLICQRLISFETEYGAPVGQLKEYKDDTCLPRPPIENENIEECKQQ